jgi:putative toxin-antitoxin system antitoxin component (TIGR02293 family)
LTAPQLPISRIVPVVAHAVAVFGDEHKASYWLTTPLPLLENHAPSEFLNSDEGIQRVDEILTRIEHNIFS